MAELLIGGLPINDHRRDQHPLERGEVLPDPCAISAPHPCLPPGVESLIRKLNPSNRVAVGGKPTRLNTSLSIVAFVNLIEILIRL